MLNPDGVINGNYRCSLAGCDLNRRWKRPSPNLHPSIYHAKQLVLNLSSERGLALFCDLHGHSRKKDLFMYGCHDDRDPARTRIFPLLLSKLCPFFSFEKSRFGVQKSMERTSRISLWKETGASNIFTMEASFCGPDKGELAGYHYTCAELMQIGRDLCRGLLYAFDCGEGIERPLPSAKNELPKGKRSGERFAPGGGLFEEGKGTNLKEAVLKELETNTELLEKGKDVNSSSGSDDCPSEDNLDKEILRQILPIRKKASKNCRVKDQLRSIFGFARKKEVKPAEKIKEQKKLPPPVKVEKKPPTKTLPPPPPKEEKVKEEPVKKNAILSVDAWTQTEKIDFQRARAKWVMNKFGKSQAQTRKPTTLPHRIQGKSGPPERREPGMVSPMKNTHPARK